MLTDAAYEDLRAELIEAAVELAAESGPEAVLLSEVARRAGVAPDAAYDLFPDRDSLVREVATRGLIGLAESLCTWMDEVTAIDPVLRARLRLGALGRGYLEYAVAHPGLLRAVFTRYPDVVQAPAGEVLPDPLGILGGALDDLCECGLLSPARRAGAEVQAWAAMHGFAMLYVEGPLRWSGEPERTEALLDHLRWTDHAFVGDLDADVWP